MYLPARFLAKQVSVRHVWCLTMAPGKSPSRQKSRNACVRSKRSCDKRAPACGTCVRRRHLCVYSGGQLELPPSSNSAEHLPLGLDPVVDPSASWRESAAPDHAGISLSLNADGVLPLDTPSAVDGAFQSLLNAVPESGFGDV
ncbi:hypothetical protein GGS23DRAFT_574734 [Durotheca rogersii]|uniref:uncharacterized protein n=1 Tax=Durotheca rogersii TaxID=419775 RepID=UPI0022210693|nr:uncharacterized protein GGS23DRAFT_574734 [Durotheca rogersii]KAI5861745.1 hypothetical protein GGS23DRAFT_574734 [Durotheca rogersii]